MAHLYFSASDLESRFDDVTITLAFNQITSDRVLRCRRDQVGR